MNSKEKDRGILGVFSKKRRDGFIRGLKKFLKIDRDKLDDFVQKRRERYTQFEGVEERIMAKILEAPEPERPVLETPPHEPSISLWQTNGYFFKALQTYRRPLSVLATILLVLCFFAVINVVIKKSGDPEMTAMSGSDIAKGADKIYTNFEFYFWVKTKDSSNLEKVKEGGSYAPGDIFQPTYSAQKTSYIHLFHIDYKKALTCFTRDSIYGLMLMPAKGSKLPLSLTLDDAPGSELFVSFISENPIKSVEVEKAIKKAIKTHSHVSPKFRELVQNTLSESGQVRYLLIHKKQP